MMLWVCLYFPQLPIDAGSAQDRKTEQAIVVIERNKVITCNHKAKSEGIAQGMSLSEVMSVSPDLKIIERDKEKERNLLYDIAEHCYAITPTVGYMFDSILLDVSRCLKLHKGLNNILNMARQPLASDLLFQVGAGPSPEAAYLMAISQRFEIEKHYDEKTGQLETSLLEQSLRTVPIALLVASKKVKSQLSAVGAKQVGDIFNIQNDVLGKRYGSDFVHYLDALRGRKLNALKHFTLKPSFKQSIQFIDGIHTIEALLNAMRKKIEALCFYLKMRHLQCNQLHWFIMFQDHPRHQVSVTLSRFQNNMNNFYLLTSMQMESFAMLSPVNEIMLEVVNFENIKAIAPTLFDNAYNDSINDEDFYGLMDRLTNRLGKNAIYQLTLTNEKLPEKSQSRVKPTLNNVQHSVIENYPMPHPLALLQQPVLLELKGSYLYYRGLKLVRLSQGEKFFTHWWDGDYQRTYYIAYAETEHRAYWVYQEYENWWLSGLYV